MGQDRRPHRVARQQREFWCGLGNCTVRRVSPVWGKVKKMSGDPPG